MFKNMNLESKLNNFKKIKIAKTLVDVYIVYCYLENKIIVINKGNKIIDRTMLKFDSTGLSICAFALKRSRAKLMEYC